MRLRSIIAASLVLLLLASVSASAQQKVTYWTFSPRLTEKLIDKFHDLYPDIQVEVVPMEFWDLHEKLMVSLAAGGLLTSLWSRFN